MNDTKVYKEIKSETREEPKEESGSLTPAPRSKTQNKPRSTYIGEFFFTDDTPGMKGQFFQLHSEKKKGGQFEDTLDQLKTFASTKYLSYIDYLSPVFIDLSQPKLVKAILINNKIKATLVDGTEIEIGSGTEQEK